MELPPPPGTRARFARPSVWSRFKQSLRTSSCTAETTNNGSADGSTRNGDCNRLQTSDTREGDHREHCEEEGELVEKIICDNDSAPENWKSIPKSPSNAHTATNTGHHPTNKSVASSHHSDAEATPLHQIYNFIRWRIVPNLVHFCSPRYSDPHEEDAFQRENWHANKTMAIFGGAYLMLVWLLAFALPRPWSLWNEVQIYGLAPLLTIPLIPAVLLDFPRKRPTLWQIHLCAISWLWPSGNIIDMRICGYYTPQAQCGNRDFQATLYYVVALSSVSLFALGQKRGYAALGGAIWMLVTCVAIVPVRVPYLRNLANVILFGCFLLYVHYSREMTERRGYTLRGQLKTQYKSTQRAQINERKSADSKRRFTAYIFHEVRVPLNTAQLAISNLEATKIEDPDHTFLLSSAKSSLEMMSQVLNDVLDFTRMERGGFSSVSRPFSFHTVMRSILEPLRIDATARGLTLETSLDLNIDAVAKRVASPDLDHESVEEGDGIVLGDEMRLRQVVNNLASNACKFTESGGKVSIVTTLIYPTPGSHLSPLNEKGIETATTPRLSASKLQQHEGRRSQPCVVVRIEVKDTGGGIKPKDLADDRLFSAYVQTEAGKLQGGKGSGLGLSLVRQIVALSGGRLGVVSKYGTGSTFWVELSLPIQMPPLRSPNTSQYEISTGGTSNSASTEASDFKFLPSIEKGIELDRIEEVGIGAGRLGELQGGYSDYESPRTMVVEPSRTNVGLPYLSPIPIPATPLAEPVANPMESLVPKPRLMDPDPLPSIIPTTIRPTASSLKTPSSTSSTTRATVAFPVFDPPLRVLIVDDDTLTRKLMSRMMERLGCVCTTAENGSVALDLLLGQEGTREDGRRNNFDITFLDNQMPILSGTEVVKRLRDLGRDDLVCGVTANALREDQEEYIALGASFVLTKPVTEISLRGMLKTAAERRSDSPHTPPTTSSTSPPASSTS